MVLLSDWVSEELLKPLTEVKLSVKDLVHLSANNGPKYFVPCFVFLYCDLHIDLQYKTKQKIILLHSKNIGSHFCVRMNNKSRHHLTFNRTMLKKKPVFDATIY